MGDFEKASLSKKCSNKSDKADFFKAWQTAEVGPEGPTTAAPLSHPSFPTGPGDPFSGLSVSPLEARASTCFNTPESNEFYQTYPKSQTSVGRSKDIFKSMDATLLGWSSQIFILLANRSSTQMS